MGRPKITRIKQCLNCGNDFDAGTRKEKKTCGEKCLVEYKEKHKDDRMKKVFESIKKKYGSDSFFKTDGFYEKAKEIKKKLYGDENYNNHQKIKETLKENHGVEHPSQTEGYAEKAKKKKMEKYNDENYNNREKAKSTNIDKYGKEHHLQSNESLEKLRKTNREKYGVDYTIQTEKSRKNLTERNTKLFGSEFYFDSETHKKQTREKKIEKIKDIIGKNGLYFDVEKYKKIRTKNKDGKLHYIKYQVTCLKCNSVFESSFDLIPVCRTCYPLLSVSVQQSELKNFLELNRVHFQEGTKKIISPFELDFYIPDMNLAIELNGNYFHSEMGGSKDKKYHLAKSQMCLEKGINLIHIFEDEWMFKRDIVESRLRNLMGISSEKTYARKCRIEKIENKEKKSFLEENHIQGDDVSFLAYGLRLNGKLVSIITFSKPRLALGIRKKTETEKTIELSRFCSAKNTNVIGAFERLVKHFAESHVEFDKLYTYADCRWSGVNPEKTVYFKCGFEYLHTTKPNYFYLKKNNYLQRHHRFRFNKQKLMEIFGKEQNLTEWEIAKKNGMDRIWDCGSMKFSLTLSDKRVSHLP